MKAASLLVMSLMLKVESLQASVTTCSWSTTSTSGSCIARRLIAEKSKPYTLSQKSIFSCLRATARRMMTGALHGGGVEAVHVVPEVYLLVPACNSSQNDDWCIGRLRSRSRTRCPRSLSSRACMHQHHVTVTGLTGRSRGRASGHLFWNQKASEMLTRCSHLDTEHTWHRCLGVV